MFAGLAPLSSASRNAQSYQISGLVEPLEFSDSVFKHPAYVKDYFPLFVNFLNK